MSAILVYLFELASTPITPQAATTLAATAGFLALTVFLLLWVLSIHQNWQMKNSDPRAQFVRLGVGANFIGCGLLSTFVLRIKGI